jgi:hypothetical protein
MKATAPTGTRHTTMAPRMATAVKPGERTKLSSTGDREVQHDVMTFTVRPGELLNSLALLGVSAASVSIVAVSDAQGEVYNRTSQLSNVITEANFYTWFFAPIKRSTVLVVTDLPLLADLEITVTINGVNRSLATFVMGNVWTLGKTLYGARIGINDYSRKENDAFGNQILVARAYSKRGDFTVWCEEDAFDANAEMLARYRATNLVWIGHERFESTVIFGWAKTWVGEIAGPGGSYFTLETEGLT